MQDPLGNTDRLLLALLRLLPKTLISRITGVLARVPLPIPLNVICIRLYAAIFRADLAEAEHPPSGYRSLNAFFTRRLKPGLRTPDPDAMHLVSPVDGRVMEAGRIVNGALIQAKGRAYSLRDLLGDPGRAADFLQGSFCTLYLSPRDYHRIHMPLDGAVESLRYLPGRLFPVNRFSVARIRDLFLLNERMVLSLETRIGRVAMVLVGATNVGKIRIFFDEVRDRFFGKQPFQRTYQPGIPLKKGDEIGCFELGSTVILLFEKGRAEISVRPGGAVRVGEAVGRISYLPVEPDPPGS